MEENKCSINENMPCKYDPKKAQVPAYKQPQNWAAIATILSLLIMLVYHYTSVSTNIKLLENRLEAERSNRELVQENMIERFETIDKNQRRTVEILQVLEQKVTTNREDVIRLQSNH